VPLKRFRVADEVSGLVAFLTFDRASFITGSCFDIDGGSDEIYPGRTSGVRMSTIYGEAQRALQEEFDTVRLADRIEQAIIRPFVPDDTKAFIESRDMLFLILPCQS
jgi:hypothetical protein